MCVLVYLSLGRHSECVDQYEQRSRGRNTSVAIEVSMQKNLFNPLSLCKAGGFPRGEEGVEYRENQSHHHHCSK